jgi:hypothetical protein
MSDIAQEFTGIAIPSVQNFLGGYAGNIMKLIITFKNTFDKHWCIRNIGPFLYRNREHIASHNVQYFIDFDFHNQKQDWTSLTYGYGGGIADILEKDVKNKLRNDVTVDSPEAECIRRLLELYCLYILRETM